MTLSILLQWDPESSCAILISPAEHNTHFTTCNSPEQLWAAVQHLSRPRALFDLDRARSALERARQKKIEDDIALNEAVALLCEARPEDYELISSPNLAKTLRKRQRNINYEDLFS